MIIRGRRDYIMVVDPCLLWAAVLIKCLCFFSGFGEALLQLFFRVTNTQRIHKVHNDVVAFVVLSVRRVPHTGTPRP